MFTLDCMHNIKLHCLTYLIFYVWFKSNKKKSHFFSIFSSIRVVKKCSWSKQAKMDPKHLKMLATVPMHVSWWSATKSARWLNPSEQKLKREHHNTGTVMMQIIKKNRKYYCRIDSLRRGRFKPFKSNAY